MSGTSPPAPSPWWGEGLREVAWGRAGVETQRPFSEWRFGKGPQMTFERITGDGHTLRRQRSEPEPAPSGAPPLSKRRAWYLALRPFSYPAAIVPVLVGTALAADTHFNPWLFILTFAGSVLIQAGTNLATDFFDFVDGVQPRATLGGAIRSGALSAKAIHRAAIGCFAAGSVCGLVIVAYAGWPILAVGFVSVLAGYFYTAGPIMYGRRGLGEVMVFLFMGVLMVMASYYVQLGHAELGGAIRLTTGGHPGGEHPARQQPARHYE